MSESNKTITIPIDLFDSLSGVAADFVLMQVKIAALRRDSLSMRKELDRKEAVLVKQIDYTKTWRRLSDSCELAGEAKNVIIDRQAATISRLSKQRRISIGPAIGYGVTLPSIKPGFTFAFVATYTFLKL